jgi:hypothetical protein
LLFGTPPVFFGIAPLAASSFPQGISQSGDFIVRNLRLPRNSGSASWGFRIASRCRRCPGGLRGVFGPRRRWGASRLRRGGGDYVFFGVALSRHTITDSN